MAGIGPGDEAIARATTGATMLDTAPVHYSDTDSR